MGRRKEAYKCLECASVFWEDSNAKHRAARIRCHGCGSLSVEYQELKIDHVSDKVVRTGTKRRHGSRVPAQAAYRRFEAVSRKAAPRPQTLSAEDVRILWLKKRHAKVKAERKYGVKLKE